VKGSWQIVPDENDEDDQGKPWFVDFRRLGGFALITTIVVASAAPFSFAGTTQACNPGVSSPTGSMTFARSGHTATLLRSGKVLVAGGWSVPFQVTTSSAELYDPTTGTWTVTGSMKTARADHVAVLLPSGKVLVAGGQTMEPSPVEARRTDTTPIRSAELYDPDSGIWTETGRMEVGGDSHGAIVLRSGKVFVMTRTPLTPDGSAQLYDAVSESWSAIDVSVESIGSATLLASGRVLIVGVGGPSPAQLYDPATKAWKPTGYDIALPRTGHTATLLRSGKVLVAGGGDGEVRRAYASALIYNPATDMWIPTRPMTTQHSGANATLLPSGDVLIAGGAGAGGQGPGNSIDLYQPATGTWAVPAVMDTPRSNFTATLLRSGALLFAGGQGFMLSSDASAETYALRCASR